MPTPNPPTFDPSGGRAALLDREGVRAGVDDALSRCVGELAAELAATHPDCAPLVDATSELLSGGKRLRAAFCYWSWRAYGGDRQDDGMREVALRAGAALELFQAAALFHDDVMDASDTRRGRPTAHRAFTALHRDRGWTGDGDRYGQSTAILLGDLALIASHRELGDATAGLPGTIRAGARGVFGRMQTEVTAGQYLDMHAQVLPWDAGTAELEQRARAVIRAKSARYSVENPLALGAALAGADEVAIRAVREFGLPLGEAFQLRDDVLGVFGDSRVTGKPAGDDLREGKRTVLVLRALDRADPSGRELLRTHLGDPHLDAVTVERIREVIVTTGALDEVEALIDDLTRQAEDALDAAALGQPGAGVLRELADAAVRRRA